MAEYRLKLYRFRMGSWLRLQSRESKRDKWKDTFDAPFRPNKRKHAEALLRSRQAGLCK